MIPFYCSNAEGATLVEIDDPDADTDLGDDFTATLVTLPISSLVPAYNHLRRISQAVAVTTSARVTILPIADRGEDPDQLTAFDLDAAVDGQEPIADARPDLNGNRFRIEISVTEHVGAVELGECDVIFNKRRGLIS